MLKEPSSHPLPLPFVSFFFFFFFFEAALGAVPAQESPVSRQMGEAPI